MTAVVLCGSLGSTAAMWEPQLPALAAAGYDSLRVDHPGHGGEPAPDGPVTVAGLAAGVLRLLDERGLERASFCGLSLGGCVGMRLAATPRTTAVPAPAPGLEALVGWTSRARAALFVTAGGLETERERVVREAAELGAAVLGEPTAATSVRLVRERVERAARA